MRGSLFWGCFSDCLSCGAWSYFNAFCRFAAAPLALLKNKDVEIVIVSKLRD